MIYFIQCCESFNEGFRTRKLWKADLFIIMNDSKNVGAAVFAFAKISKWTEIFNPMMPSRYWSVVEISKKSKCNAKYPHQAKLMEIRYINFITYLIIIVSLLNCPKFNQLEWTQKTTCLLRQTQTLPNFWALKIRSNFWRILWFKYFSHSATLMWQGVLCIQIRDLFSREGTSEGNLAIRLDQTF